MVSARSFNGVFTPQSVCCFTRKNKGGRAAFCDALEARSRGIDFTVVSRPDRPRVLLLEGYPKGLAIAPDQPTPANSVEIIEGKLKIQWRDRQSG
jgi:hypothetical protein